MNLLTRITWTLATLGALANPTAMAQGIGGGLEAVGEAERLEDKRGNRVPADLTFTDSRGYPLKLRQFLPGDRPILLNLVWFNCPGMCGEVMNQMTRALKEIDDLRPDRDFVILTISIDSREKPALAALKKDAYLDLYDVEGAEAGWHFAVGDEESIRRISEATGFRWRWSEQTEQIVHPPALTFLSPTGEVSGYLQDLVFRPSDMRLALIKASEGELGGFWDRVQLSCLTFDPTTGSFSITAMTIMRIGGVLTVLFLVIVIFAAVRREKRRKGKPRADEALSPSATT